MGIFSDKKNVILLVIFVAAVLYALYSIIFVRDNTKAIELKAMTKEEVAIYTIDENIVHSYNTFYTLEDISSQIISSLENGKYSEVYSLISSDLVGDISKEEWQKLLKEFYDSNFLARVDEQGETVEYNYRRIIINAYAVRDNDYIVEINNNIGSSVKLGIRLLSNSNYEIMYIEF